MTGTKATGMDVPPSKGLYLVHGSGDDQESTPSLVAAGAQIVAFTTGHGTTLGNAIAPVAKIAFNTPTFEWKASRCEDGVPSP